MNNTNTKPAKELTSTTNDAADYICHFLERIETKYVFGIPGGSLEPFYSALARSQKRGGITPIISRHESGAAFMADGYARETGKLGVCCATSGPGATNMITGVASAYQDNIPLLVITAQSSLHTFGKGAVQESSCTGVSTTGMYNFCTRYNSFISHVDQIEYKLHAAVQAAIMGATKGPSHLSIPLDILRKQVDLSALNNLPEKYKNNKTLIDYQATEELISKLKPSKKVVFLVGPGASEALGKILSVAAILNARIVSTPEAKGLINSYHPLYYGVYGFAGHDQAYDTVADPGVDYILAIGTKMDEHASNGWDNKTILTNKLIHIDSELEHFYQSPISSLQVGGNIKLIFDHINKALGANLANNNIDNRTSVKNTSVDSNPSLAKINANRHHLQVVPTEDTTKVSDRTAYSHRNFSLINEEKCFSNATPIKPQRLMFELSRCFPPSTRYVADIGNSFLWAIHYLQPKDRRISGDRSAPAGMLRMGMGFASMGWAIGGAIGTAVGSKGSPVVAIIGDGSLLMNGQELTVALEHKLPVVFVVLNDSAFGTVKHGQIMTKAERIGYELPKVDFKKMALSMGIAAHTIRKPQDLLALDINDICNSAGPTLLDVHVDEDEMPPLTSRIKVLGWDKEKEMA